MVQKNRMMGQRITDQNQEIKEREWFELYTSSVYMQVHKIKGAYTYACSFTNGKGNMG